MIKSAIETQFPYWDHRDMSSVQAACEGERTEAHTTHNPPQNLGTRDAAHYVSEPWPERPDERESRCYTAT